MRDNSDIRNEILSKIEFIQSDNELQTRLNSLTLFNDKKNLDMKKFYSDFLKIISWDEINSIQYRNDVELTNKKFQKILSILAWAKALWVENAISGDLDKIIISFIIVERLFLNPEEDLSWDFDFTKIKEKLEKTLPLLKFEISDKLPTYAGYSDKKFHSDYRRALETNNYNGIFLFFDAIERGIGLRAFGDESLIALISISSMIDIKLLSNNIGKYSPPLMFLIINTLSKKNVLELLELYTEQNLLPLLIGLKRLFEQERVIQDKERDMDLDYIEKCSKILEKIADRINEDTLYKFITESIHINRNKIWHLVFTAFIAKNEEYLNDYSANIDFTCDNYGEESFDVFIHFATDEKLDILSTKIYSHFVSYIKSVEYQQHPFFFSSYYKYFLQAIPIISENNYSKYLQELETISISLLRCLYSWNVKEKDPHFTQFIYWLLASKYFSHTDKKVRINLQYTYKILNDERIMNLLKIKIGDTLIIFNELQLLLEESEKVHKIILPANERVIELCWSQ